MFHLASVVQWLIALASGALVAVAVGVLVVVVTGLALQPAGWGAVLIATGRAGVFVSVASLVCAVAKARRLRIESREIIALLASTDLDDHAPPPRPPRPTPRNIVICCDGTGNLARTGQDFGQADSNVAKFYDLLVPQEDCGWRQTSWYCAGVGTGTSRASRRIGALGRAAGWLKQNVPGMVIGVVGKYRTVMGLAFGIGITENILEGYRNSSGSTSRVIGSSSSGSRGGPIRHAASLTSSMTLACCARSTCATRRTWCSSTGIACEPATTTP